MTTTIASTGVLPPAAERNESVSTLDSQVLPTWQRMVEPVAKWGAPQDDEDQTIGSRRLRFLQAGLRHRSAPVVFYAVKVVLAVMLPLLAWATLHLSAVELQGLPLVAVLLVAASLGTYGPQAWLSRRIGQRQQALLDAFPDAIDLMIVCVESGLGLDMAMDRAGREMALRSRVLSEEFDWLCSELRLGRPRAHALRQLAERTGLDEVRMFVAMVLQADRFGVSIAQAMRVHAQELRNRRQLRAEEAAAELPLKMLFPLIFALFPALMVVLMGPAAISVARQLMPTLGAG